MQNRKKITKTKIAGWEVHIFIRVLLHPYCALRGVRGWMSGKVLIRGRELYCYAVFVSAFEMHYSPFLNYSLSASFCPHLLRCKSRSSLSRGIKK